MIYAKSAPINIKHYMSEKNDYIAKKYITKDRWNNYWYQVGGIREFENAREILEIGPGNKIVSDLLKKLGFSVKTLDINEKIGPDYVASADALPVPDKSFDVVLAGEVIEHLPFEKFDKILLEIKRVARGGAVISLPHSGYAFSLGFKIPIFNWQFHVIKIPHFWRAKTSTPEHCWEIGIKNYPTKKIKNKIKKAGFKIVKNFIGYDDPAHMFFVLRVC